MKNGIWIVIVSYFSKALCPAHSVATFSLDGANADRSNRHAYYKDWCLFSSLHNPKLVS